MPTTTIGSVPDIQHLKQAYHQVRRQTEQLCEPLALEDYVIQSMPDASPAKWHLGHTTWFFERFVLQEHLPRYEPHHARYGYLFNSYYNAAGPMHCRPNRGLISRPTVAEVLAYRRAIDEQIDVLLDQMGADEAGGDRLRTLMTLGLNHEQQHQELMVTDLKHMFSSNPLLPAYRDAPRQPLMESPGPAQWLPYEGGVREIGCDVEGTSFCYDNETPRHKVYVQSFELADRLATNAEYLAFVEDGGYRRADLWLSLGWATVQQEGWSCPIYWYRDESGQWMQYTLTGPRLIDPAEPVCHLSYFEADAFARWCNARLPTEAEWEVAAQALPIAGRFADSGDLHPHPTMAGGVGSPRDLFGNLWEWTQSAYSPYPGYEAPAGALGEYNGKFMCNQYVLRGGSCATPRSHIRATYRNFFSPQSRWQFAGVRLAR